VVAIPEFALKSTASLWDHLPKAVESEQPLTMEQVDQAYGYILYRTQLPAAVHGAALKLDHVQDFALVYVNGKRVGTLDRHFHQDTMALETDGPARLDILVENLGRLNSTKWMRDERKGIRGVSLAGVALTGWQIYSFPMQAEEEAKDGGEIEPQTPHFAAGSFTLDKVGDSFLDVRSLGKGLIWVNGHPLGRFWNIGPQGTMYVPGPWLKKGRNEVVVFEALGTTEAPKLVGLMKPILDAPTPGYENDPERKKKSAEDAEFGPKLAAPAGTQPKTPKE
jgi:beta-galactosidase